MKKYIIRIFHIIAWIVFFETHACGLVCALGAAQEWHHTPPSTAPPSLTHTAAKGKAGGRPTTVGGGWTEGARKRRKSQTQTTVQQGRGTEGGRWGWTQTPVGVPRVVHRWWALWLCAPNLYTLLPSGTPINSIKRKQMEYLSVSKQ